MHQVILVFIPDFSLYLYYTLSYFSFTVKSVMILHDKCNGYIFIKNSIRTLCFMDYWEIGYLVVSVLCSGKNQISSNALITADSISVKQELTIGQVYFYLYFICLWPMAQTACFSEIDAVTTA
jgi:hypothetical protein